MTKTTTGWVIFVAAIGMMLGLASIEIINLPAWESANSPAFVGKLLAHMATVIAAFVGGKLIPSGNQAGE